MKIWSRVMWLAEAKTYTGEKAAKAFLKKFKSG
jgi:hypothetical protein